MGRTAAQVLGGADVDEHGVAGVEKYFDQRLFSDTSPLRLSIDVRVQAVVRDELSKAIEFFQAIGGCGIVMDVQHRRGAGDGQPARLRRQRHSALRRPTTGSIAR